MDSTVLKNQLLVSKWTALISECRNSGMPVKDWLAQNQVSKDQYYYWNHKLKNLCLDSIQPAFVELPAPVIEKKCYDAASKVASIQVGTTSIDIFETASADFLCKLFEAAAHVK